VVRGKQRWVDKMASQWNRVGRSAWGLALSVENRLLSKANSEICLFRQLDIFVLGRLGLSALYSGVPCDGAGCLTLPLGS
jgi:hypothetical protein